MPKAYHGAVRAPTPSASVKLAPPPVDVRDQWRRQVASDPAVGARALRVALALENYVRGRDGRTTVGLGRLGDDLCMDRRGVERGIADLARLGHVRRVQGKGQRGNGGFTAETWLTLRPVDKSVNKSSTAGEGTGQTGQKVPASVTGETPLNPKSARAPASQGERAAPIQQRELPLLGDVRRAGPEQVAAALKAIRRKLGDRRRAPPEGEET